MYSVRSNNDRRRFTRRTDFCSKGLGGRDGIGDDVQRIGNTTARRVVTLVSNPPLKVSLIDQLADYAVFCSEMPFPFSHVGAVDESSVEIRECNDGAR